MVLLLVLACPDAGTEDGSGDSGPPAPTMGLETRPSNPTCLAPDRPPVAGDVAFVPVFPDLRMDLPVALAHPPGDDSRWWLVEQGGRVLVFDNRDTVSDSAVALDLSDRISQWAGNEDGLLGMAFHPDFADNGDAFFAYSAGGTGGMTNRVSRVHSSDGGRSFDPDSEEVLLDIEDRFINHNGGHLAFGPDGYLYVGTGDGGSAGDPDEHGQDPFALLGKMLRIDVDGGTPYAIPADNPYADGRDGAPEVYATGLRNPWRYSFDRASGVLWVADVGQDAWEEVDLVELGGNYGWNEKEGTHCYDHDPCEGPYLDPIYEYSHEEDDPYGGVSITGGYVYRGSAIPDLVGTYVFGDAYRGSMFGLRFDAEGEPEPVLYPAIDGIVASFAEDEAGELYVVDYYGAVYRMQPAGEPEPDTFPKLLSETGCVDPADPTQAAEGLIPYGVNVPLWSDGADKTRWLAIPDTTTLRPNEDGSFEFPIGTVLVKEFSFDGVPIETRLFVLHDDGKWAGYTYEWNEAGTDADLLPADKSVTVRGRDWTFPSRGQCLQCHTSVSGRVLGVRTQQLAGDFTYPNGVTEDQREVWTRIGLLEGDFPAVASYPPLDGSEPVEDRARAYLATNCSFCHQPEGTGGGAMDLRYETAFADAQLCGEEAVSSDLGVEGALLFAPGDAAHSLLSLRMQTLDAWRMPPLATQVVDAGAVSVIDAWIASVAACP